MTAVEHINLKHFFLHCLREETRWKRKSDQSLMKIYIFSVKPLSFHIVFLVQLEVTWTLLSFLIGNEFFLPNLWLTKFEINGKRTNFHSLLVCVVYSLRNFICGGCPSFSQLSNYRLFFVAITQTSALSKRKKQGHGFYS